MKRFLRNALFVIIGLLIAIQFIPVQRTNPAITREVKWNAPETRAIAKRACFDCHSNETTWPWYAYVAPISLRLASHVTEGRERLNFSAWDQPNESYSEVEKVLREDEMPLWDYLLMHTDAKLSDADKQALLAGLKATYANDPPIKKTRGGR
ncbi:MAG: heme-binding domain-containing protein [Chloroflexi bacterium]|nr:heme-binding domain-containing protein [Chloroflexota bacterium]